MTEETMWRLVLFGKTIISFGRSSTKLMAETKVKARLAEITADQKVSLKLQQIVELLQSDNAESSGKCTGVVIVGAPGDARTLLARAFAGEAQVPLFSISGPDFIDTAPGVAQSRIHDLFEQVRKRSPCVLLIDEIDAIFSQQTKNSDSANEVKKTQKQILSEIDGGAKREILVVVITKSLDMTDPGLLARDRFPYCFRIEGDKSGNVVYSCP
jgi:cell division protease FtsH